MAVKNEKLEKLEKANKSDVAKIGKVLFTQEQITKRAKEIAAEIDRDFEGEDIILLCTLKGSILWMADIMKYMKSDAKIDFIQASSYGASTTSSGIVKISHEPTLNMYEKVVIVIEDIVDTGRTLAYLLPKLQERGPKTVKLCTMLNKNARREDHIEADYIGFEVDDLFIIGYGLDFDQRFRGLPYISYLDMEEVEKL
ncbi:MAG: hypoxanthine phosphoribosyltransferase [Mogibacterium sp.]|nr:hypoxanthine phosphoribosyltransferase [Mogibacterium sp.]